MFKFKVKGYIVFSNSDIFFDETMECFKTSIIHSKCWYSLLRYEYYNKKLYGLTHTLKIVGYLQ